MNKETESLIRETADWSNAGQLHFGEVVQRLLGVGVESYQVDYRARRATYYMPEGETLSLEMAPPQVEIANAFSVAAVKAAIAKAQSGEVMYPEFKRLTQAAGCTGYIVWLSGRQVTYLGRRGEFHVEKFPD